MHRTLAVPSPLLFTALLLAACGDNGAGTGDVSTGPLTGTETGSSPTSTPTSTPATDTTPTSDPSTDATDSGMSASGTMATMATMATDPATDTNPTTVTTTTNPTSATDTDPGTTGDTTTGAVSGTTSTSGSTGDDTTGGDDSTTGEDPNFGEIPETCEQAILSKSTVGCLFYAIDMDSHDLAELGQYAVAVANVQKMSPANVTIERKLNNVWEVIAGPTQVGTLNLSVFNLPDKHTDDSQLGKGFAYRVKSDVPVIAYQFNPVDGQNSFLSDAAMLYPVTAWDHINHAITFTSTTDNTNTAQHSYASAVAFADGTKITVTPSVATKAGAGVPAGQPGVPFEVTLDEGDVLSVAVNQIGTSLSGTIFESVKDTPFGMFAGLECALIPADKCCCDHMEEQISGVRLWGK
ncbi:MAG TPA: IgGFc-binding protein, partial [Nannocystis sp.]